MVGVLACAGAAMLPTGAADRPHARRPPAANGPVGNGFVVTAGDLSFILKQIKIAERHSADFVSKNPVDPADPERLQGTGRAWRRPDPGRA